MLDEVDGDEFVERKGGVLLRVECVDEGVADRVVNERYKKEGKDRMEPEKGDQGSTYKIYR